MIRKIIKLLELSNSISDPESLSAIRKANDILREQNTTWSELFEITQTDKKIINTIITNQYILDRNIKEITDKINTMHKSLNSIIAKILFVALVSVIILLKILWT